MLGGKPAAPAATLFLFATDCVAALQDPSFNLVAKLVQEEGGFVCVSLDLPAHGEDARPGQPYALKGWHARAVQGEDFVSPFAARATALLDHLIKEGYTDPHRVAVAGISRGGFLAFQVAARDPRFGAIVGFSPVTDLLALTEFTGAEHYPVVAALAGLQIVDRLAGRPIWIMIGSNDSRVGTSQCIAFARVLTAAGQTPDRVAPVELHVMPSPGHRTPTNAPKLAAAWLREQMARRP